MPDVNTPPFPSSTTASPQENALDQQKQSHDLGERDHDGNHPARNGHDAQHGHEAEHGSGEQHGGDHKKDPSAPQVEVDTTSRLGRGPMVLVALGVLALAAVIVFGILHRSHNEKTLKTQTAEAAIPNVAVVSPTQGAGPQEIRLPADTQAYTDTSIYSRTNGYLLKWYADIGTNVRKGQLLAVVQTPEVDQQVQQAQADVATAKANAELARTTNERWKALLAKNAVSRQEADQTASDLLVKESALNASQANYRRLMQLQSFERIYAPFDGVVTARNVDIGSLIQAGDSNMPHSELFHINSIGTLRLYVPVPEVYAADVHDREQVKVTSDAYAGEMFTGTIVRNSTSIDTTSRTLRVEVDVPNLAHRLLPGQYTFIHLPVPARPTSMTLPSNTLLFRAEGLRVGVVRDGRVQLTPVSIGHDYGATVEITEGLKTSDKVIVNPSDSLASGMQVNVEAH